MAVPEVLSTEGPVVACEVGPVREDQANGPFPTPVCTGVVVQQVPAGKAAPTFKAPAPLVQPVKGSTAGTFNKPHAVAKE